MKLTNADLAILSLVGERPRHGYQIEQVIEERGMREWTRVGFSSIYYVLKKLERGGLIEGKVETQKGPGLARRVYTILPTGKKSLQGGIVEALSVPQPSYLPFQLGLANLPAISPDRATQALHSYQDRLSERLEQIQERWEAQKPLPYFVEAMFGHSTSLIQAEMNWLTTFIRQLESQDSDD